MTDKLINGIKTVLEKKAGIVDKTVNVAKKVAHKGKRVGELITGKAVKKAKGAAKKLKAKAKTPKGGVNDFKKMPSKLKQSIKADDIVAKAEKAQAKARTGVTVGAGIAAGGTVGALVKGDKTEKVAQLDKVAYYTGYMEKFSGAPVAAPVKPAPVKAPVARH